MQVQPADRAKAIVLIVAIVGVMGFVVKTALFRPKPEQGPPPPVATAPPPGTTGPTAMNTPPPGGPPGTLNPAPTAGSAADLQAPGVNPFRATVETKKDGSRPRPPKGGNPPGPGMGPGPFQPGGEIIAEAEFRLAGVLIDQPSVAIVTRGGRQTQFLRVGNYAAYGYRIAEIRPRGIRVSQKNSSKWVKVGELLQPPASAIPVVPPVSRSDSSGGTMIGAGVTPGWDVARLPDVQINTNRPQPARTSFGSQADDWLTDIDAAKSAARRAGKRIFVDFMATWCGPCKKLDEEVLTTSRFQKYSSKVVFLRIDVDAQPNVAQAYKVSAMPTQMVLRADGSIIRSKVGYSNPDNFFAFLDNALGA